MKLPEAIEVIRIYKEGNVMVAHERLMEAIDTVVKEVEKPPITERDMHLNMQYYMEYCKMKGYVTPMEWIEKHKHF